MVKLTDGERLLAVMLADIMEHFKVDSEVDPAFLKAQISSNSDWALGWKYDWIFKSEDPVDVAVIDETTTILNMFRAIEASIDNLQDPDKAELAAHPYARFHGFDGNHDPHIGVTRTLIEHLDRYQEFAGRGLNSHSQGTLPRYRDMLDRYNEVLNAKPYGLLTADELRQILD